MNIQTIFALHKLQGRVKFPIGGIVRERYGVGATGS